MVFERRVLIAVDNEQRAKRALDYYLNHLRQPKDQLVLIYVFVPPKDGISPQGYGMEPGCTFLNDVLRTPGRYFVNGKRICHNAQHEAELNGVKTQSYIYANSSPGAAIVCAIKEHGCSLVIMELKDTNGILGNQIGRVSSYVLHHANIPVTIVPTYERPGILN